MKVPGSKSGSSAPTGPGTLAHARTLWPGPGLPRATLVLADLGPGDGPRHPAPGCPDARRHPLRKSARPPHTAYCPGARRSARRTVCAPHGARAAGDVTACASVSPALISEGPGVSSLLWHKSHSHRTWDPEKGGEAAGSSRRGHTNAAGAVGPRTWPAPQQGKQKAVQGEGGLAGRAGGTGAQLSPWGPTLHISSHVLAWASSKPLTPALVPLDTNVAAAPASEVKGRSSASRGLSWAEADVSHTEGRRGAAAAAQGGRGGLPPLRPLAGQRRGAVLPARR